MRRQLATRWVKPNALRTMPELSPHWYHGGSTDLPVASDSVPPYMLRSPPLGLESLTAAASVRVNATTSGVGPGVGVSVGASVAMRRASDFGCDRIETPSAASTRRLAVLASQSHL